MINTNLSSNDRVELERHLQRTTPEVAESFRALISAALQFPSAALGFPKSEYIVFKSSRCNFAECQVQSNCVRIRLRRKAVYADPRQWLKTEPSMLTYPLNQYFKLESDSDQNYAAQLLRTSFEDASSLEPTEIMSSNKVAFSEHLEAENVQGSGKASSYVIALDLLNRMLNIESFGFDDCRDVWSVSSAERLLELRDRVREEEKRGDKSPWATTDIPKSYLAGGYCKAALRLLAEFLPYQSHAEKILRIYRSHQGDESTLANKLGVDPEYPECFVHDPLSKDGKDRMSERKTRIGQGAFRSVILDIYQNRCCLTGLDIPSVNRASHIIGWADPKGKPIRMDPRNGLCLSATYDSAFDKHLISLDDDYRMILSKEIKDHYTSESVSTYFRSKEGQQITLPDRFRPEFTYLSYHQSKGAF